MNKKTETVRSSWYVRARFCLVCDQTKLVEFNVRSVKRLNEPIFFDEETYDPPPPPEIPEATPIDSFLQVNTIAVPDKEP